MVDTRYKFNVWLAGSHESPSERVTLLVYGIRQRSSAYKHLFASEQRVIIRPLNRPQLILVVGNAPRGMLKTSKEARVAVHAVLPCHAKSDPDPSKVPPLGAPSGAWSYIGENRCSLGSALRRDRTQSAPMD